MCCIAVPVPVIPSDASTAPVAESPTPPIAYNSFNRHFIPVPIKVDDDAGRYEHTEAYGKDEEVEPEEAETTTTKRPRVVGPPIRRPRPKGSGGTAGGRTKGAIKTGTGEGKCPPGNDPTRDELTGNIILCSGLEPNCPPRSYCFVTLGGFAVEEYNCCKSW